MGVYIAVGGGQLGYPCLPGDSCADSNAVCQLGVCLCHDNFFEKNTRCCTFVTFQQLLWLLIIVASAHRKLSACLRVLAV